MAHTPEMVGSLVCRPLSGITCCTSFLSHVTNSVEMEHDGENNRNDVKTTKRTDSLLALIEKVIPQTKSSESYIIWRRSGMLHIFLEIVDGVINQRGGMKQFSSRWWMYTEFLPRISRKLIRDSGNSSCASTGMQKRLVTPQYSRKSRLILTKYPFNFENPWLIYPSLLTSPFCPEKTALLYTELIFGRMNGRNCRTEKPRPRNSKNSIGYRGKLEQRKVNAVLIISLLVWYCRVALNHYHTQ